MNLKVLWQVLCVKWSITNLEYLDSLGTPVHMAIEERLRSHPSHQASYCGGRDVWTLFHGISFSSVVGSGLAVITCIGASKIQKPGSRTTKHIQYSELGRWGESDSLVKTHWCVCWEKPRPAPVSAPWTAVVTSCCGYFLVWIKVVGQLATTVTRYLYL